jgi:hypothetical protein
MSGSDLGAGVAVGVDVAVGRQHDRAVVRIALTGRDVVHECGVCVPAERVPAVVPRRNADVQKFVNGQTTESSVRRSGCENDTGQIFLTHERCQLVRCHVPQLAVFV